MDIPLSQWFYAANLLLGFIVFAVLVYYATKRWGEFPYEVKLLHLLSGVLLAGLLVVSGQRLLMAEGQVFDGAIIFCVKASALVIIWKIRNALYRTGTRHPGNGDSDNPNRNIVA